MAVLSWNERLTTRIGQFGLQDISRAGQIALGMATHKFQIFGKGHVAFDNACTHIGSGNIAFATVLGISQRGAAMGDGELGRQEGPIGAALQSLFEWARGQVGAECQCSARWVDFALGCAGEEH